MTDVVEIAKEHHARLEIEIAEVDDFIRMAEKLMEGGRNNAEDEENSSPILLH